nr:MAG TPA: hypothetical protein [Caudoviricetes sp.]
MVKALLLTTLIITKISTWLTEFIWLLSWQT